MIFFYLYVSMFLDSESLARDWTPAQSQLCQQGTVNTAEDSKTSPPHSNGGDKRSKSKGYLSRCPMFQYGIWSSNMSLFFWLLTNGAASIFVNWTSFSSAGSHCGLDSYMEGNVHHFQIQALEQVIVCGNKWEGLVWLMKKIIFSFMQPGSVKTHSWVKLFLFYTGTILLLVSLMTAFMIAVV